MSTADIVWYLCTLFFSDRVAFCGVYWVALCPRYGVAVCDGDRVTDLVLDHLAHVACLGPAVVFGVCMTLTALQGVAVLPGYGVALLGGDGGTGLGCDRVALLDTHRGAGCSRNRVTLLCWDLDTALTLYWVTLR